MSKYQRHEIDKILQEMRSDYWRNLEEVEESDGHVGTEYLTVRVRGTRYGLPAAVCREVLRMPTLVRVPRLPEYLRGIFNLRGEIVAVTDIGPLLGQGAQQIHEDCRLIIVEEGAMKTALVVGAVEGLTRVEEDLVEPLAEGAGAGARDLIAGKMVRGEYLLVLLDIKKLLARPELVIDQKQRSDDSA